MTNTKIKFHIKLNDDVSTRRKTETKKNRKAVKPERVAYREKQKKISKARHYRNSDSPHSERCRLLMSNGQFEWIQDGEASFLNIPRSYYTSCPCCRDRMQ